MLRREWRDDAGDGETYIESMRDLQSHVRRSAADYYLDPLVILTPFLMLLKGDSVPNLFKLISLDAMTMFLNNDVLMSSNSYDGDKDEIDNHDNMNSSILSSAGKTLQDVLMDMVDVITACTFDEQDKRENDGQIVQLQMLQLLNCLMKSSVAQYITDDTLWLVVKYTHNVLLRAGTSDKGSVYQAAGYTMQELINFIFREEITVSGESPETEGNLGSPRGGRKACALKVLGYFMSMVRVHAMKGSSENTVAGSGDAPPAVPSSSLSGAASASEPYASDVQTIELVLALRSIHSIILIEGNVIKRGLVTLKSYLLTPPFSTMFRDDFSKYLILLVMRTDYPLIVTQTLVDVFCSMVSAFGPVVRLLIEYFMRHVYLKALHQTLRLFADQDDVLNGGDASILNAQGSTQIASMTDEFTVPHIELILESLADLVSDSDFMPSLFASFDCDPSKPNIVHMMVNYLSRCTRYHLFSSNTTEFGAIQDVSYICFSVHSQILMSLADRSERAKANDCSSEATSIVSSDSVARRVLNLRHTKTLLSEAATRFSSKPTLAFRFLQEHGYMSNPTTPSEVARFLRVSHDLSIESVGGYLGELGKSSHQESHESESIAFHEEVLTQYIESFEFTGCSLLEAVRIFLSAFLLPKEGQQIERIFTTLSEYCHKTCLECVNGALENSDVTYLMTMSIIMLNTDRHNENIKPEKKMSLEKFINVNTFYGKDVKQTIPLAREYLENIFNSISKYPLRTEKKDISGGMTSEMWAENQLQLVQHPEEGFMVTTAVESEALRVVSLKLGLDWPDVENTNAVDSVDDEEVGRMFLKRRPSRNPLIFSAALYEKCWVFDKTLLECIWTEVLGVGCCPFIVSRMPPRVPDRLHPEKWTRREATQYTVRCGIDVLTTLLKIAGVHRMQNVVDTVIVLLAEFAGFIGYSASDTLFDQLALEYADLAHKGSHFKSLYSSKEFVKNLMRSLPSRAALTTLLQLVSKSPSQICDSWAVVLYTLSFLRDCSLLPNKLVLEENKDLLPTRVREVFEDLLYKYEYDEQQQQLAMNQEGPPKRGIFGFFFGSGDNSSQEAPPSIENQRWDAGYEGIASTTHSGANAAPVSSTPIVMKQIFESEKFSLSGEGHDATKGALNSVFYNLRSLVDACEVEDLVSDTKFFPDKVLLSFIESILYLNELPVVASSTSEDAAHMPVVLQGLITDIPSVSISSAAWLENLLVAVLIRNRDRFQLLWPLVQKHYSSLGQAKKLSYVLERRVVGILKISERMMSRSQHTEAMISFLGSLFAPSETLSLSPADVEVTEPLSENIMVDVSGQMASGLWRILTMNVEMIPLLGLEYWQIIFDMLAFCSSTGGYASVKAFESLAWLLYERRLQAEVPVFCVVGIKPLLNNNKVPTSISIGAVKLLSHLHTRLDVLVKDEGSSSNTTEEEDSDRSAVWEVSLRSTSLY